MLNKNIRSIDDIEISDFVPFHPVEAPQKYKEFLRKFFKFDSALNESEKQNALSLCKNREHFFRNMIKRNERMIDLLDKRGLFIKEIVQGMVDWMIRSLMRFSFHLTDDPDDAVTSFEMIMTSISVEVKRLAKRFRNNDDELSREMEGVMEQYGDDIEALCFDILERYRNVR